MVLWRRLEPEAVARRRSLACLLLLVVAGVLVSAGPASLPPLPPRAAVGYYSPFGITWAGAAFSPDGRRLATVGASGTAQVWDVGSGRRLLTLRHRPDESDDLIVAVFFTPGGERVITVSEDTARVWDA